MKAYFDGRFKAVGTLAPLFWLLIVWLSVFGMLGAVGYLSLEENFNIVLEARDLLVQNTPDFAARRGALAFSGVTLAITLALSVTGIFWAISSALLYCEWQHWLRVLCCVVVYLAITVAIALTRSDDLWGPFTSQLGSVLLEPSSSHTKLDAAGFVPVFMLLLSCFVPGALLAGACFLLQPMYLPYRHQVEAREERPEWLKVLSDQVAILGRRMRELDQMLYIGALALVFGTLQLSAGLSVPLVSLPQSADLKARADLCKTMAPTPSTKAPFFAPVDSEAAIQRVAAATAAASAASAAAALPGATAASVAESNTVWRRNQAIVTTADELKEALPTSLAGFERQCQAVAKGFANLDAADGLRDLVRNVTLSFGLAFSALLAAIYVPAAIVLRDATEARHNLLPKKLQPATGAADPLTRIGAVVATLSPLLAGLVANTLASK
jgi:hypothetical protein